MTTLKSLENEFRLRIGDITQGAWQWQPEQIIDILEAGLRKHNQEGPAQQFAVTGAGDARTFSPDPSSDDINLILLYGELLQAESELSTSIRFSARRTTPLATFDPTRIAVYWQAKIKTIKQQIKDHKDSANHDYIMNQIEARPMSMSEPSSVATETVTGIDPSDIATRRVVDGTL